MLVLAVNVHAVGYCKSSGRFLFSLTEERSVYKWSAEGTFTQSIKLPMVVWGFVGLVCVDILYVFSTPFWRQRAYNVFLSSHFIGFGLLLPAVSPTIPFYQ